MLARRMRRAGAALGVDDLARRAERHLGGVTLDAGRRLRRRWNYGTPIWEHEWDLLIVLDACRWDLFCEVAPEFEFLPDEYGSTYSPASMSEEWLEVHTADRYREELARTALLSGNVNTVWRDRFQDRWGYINEIWREGWDDEEGTVPARAVTDTAIDYLRNRVDDDRTDRTVVWYFQPHRPFVPVEWSGGFCYDRLTDREGENEQENEFKRYRDGDLSRERLWTAYAANLRYALADVKLLVDNADVDRAVITSDHANLLGEWGIYEHPRDFPAPALRRVPWVSVDADDRETHDSGYDLAEGAQDDVSETEVRDRLRHLGYSE